MTTHTTKSTTVDNLAQLYRRLIARMLDFWVFFMIPMVILMIALQNYIGEILAIFMIWYLLHFTVFAARFNGQTLGKRLLRVRVVMINGSNISALQLLLRHLVLEFTTIGPILFLVGVFSKNKQFLHDMAVNTLVVKK